VVDCDVDNTSHCHILHNNVHSALCEAFPVSKIKKKSFITDATFKHICDASDLKKKRLKLFKIFKNAPLWAAFGVWANKSWRCCWSTVWGFSSYSKLHAWVKAGFAIQYLNTHINSMLKLESLAFFSESADNVVSSFNNGDAKQFFNGINSVLKIANNKTATPKCLRIIDSHTDKPSQSVVQEKQAFRRHFANLMGGEVCSFESLVHKDRNSSVCRYDNVTKDEIDAVPTLFDLFNCFMKFIKGKACGEGLLVSDVFKMFPYHLAVIFYPLVVKTFVRIQPPLQWKGGMICDLFKNKGSPALIQSYRDVLLMDDDGKGVQRLVRKKLFPLANVLCIDSQCGGGLNGGETAIAHLYLRLFVYFINNSQKSGAIVFYDVCSPFATLLRRIVFDIDQGDEHWLYKLSAAGFTQDDIESIYEFVSQNFFTNVDSGPQDSAGNNLLFNLAQEWYKNTWTSQEYIPNVTNTTTGSSAGTPFADMIYSLAMSRVLRTMRRSLHNEGLETSLETSDGGGGVPLADVSFVDDMALPIVDSAAMITDHIADVCGIVYLTFLMYGMELNFSPGKSAVILKFQGPGKKKAVMNLFDAKNFIRINKLPDEFNEIVIGVVDTYKHLGTQISFKGMCFELAYRCGLMRAETCKLRSILRNSELFFIRKCI